MAVGVQISETVRGGDSEVHLCSASEGRDVQMDRAAMAWQGVTGGGDEWVMVGKGEGESDRSTTQPARNDFSNLKAACSRSEIISCSTSNSKQGGH